MADAPKDESCCRSSPVFSFGKHFSVFRLGLSEHRVPHRFDSLSVIIYHFFIYFPYSLGILWGESPFPYRAILGTSCPAWSEQALADESEMDIAGLIESLQGQWEDDVGLSIKVNGNEVVSWLDYVVLQ